MQVTASHRSGSSPGKTMPGKNCFAFLKGQRQRKSELDAEPEESPGSSSSSSSSSSTGAVNALSAAPAPAQASAGEPGQSGDSSCSDSDSPVDSTDEEEEDEEEEDEDEEEDPAMFSSKFLSGANPLSAVSSAVNKFGLFGDDSDGDKNQKTQQGAKPPGEQQPAAGPGKGAPPQQQRPQNQGQGPPPKQGSSQNGRAGSPNVPATDGQVKGQAKGPPQQGSPKPGVQQIKSGAQPGSPQQQTKTGTVDQGPTKTGPQQKEPVKTEVSPKPGSQQGSPKVGGQQQGAPKPGQQGSPKVEGQQQGSPKPGQQGSPQVGGQQQGSPKPGQQGSPKVGGQQQGSPKPGQQGSPKVGGQQQGSPKPGQQGSPKIGGQQQGSPKPGQQGSPKPTPQQQQGLSKSGQSSDKPPQPGPKGSGTPGQSRAGSSSPAVTKAGTKSQICSVCNTTELNMHTKEAPNYKTCTQCKTEVCSLCGFSPPDSDGREWLCLTCQIQRAQGSDPSGPQMKKPTPSKASPAQNQKSPVPVKKEPSASSSPLKSQPSTVPAKTEAVKGPESQKQVNAQKMTTEAQKLPQKPEQSPQPGRKQSSDAPTAPQQSGGLFGFGGSKPEAAKSKETVTGKMFGFGSSFLSSASTLIASAVEDETKTTPPVSPKMQPANQTKTAVGQKSEQEKKQGQAQQSATPGQTKVDKADTPKDKTASNALKDVPSACPICKMGLNKGTGKPPNYSTCTDCKSIVCNQCGFNPMPNVKEGKEWLCLNCQVKRAAGGFEPEVKTSAQSAPQKMPTPGSPQSKAQPAKTEGPKGLDKDSHKQASQTPGQKTPQESHVTGPQKKPDQTIQTAQKPSNATPAAQQESGGFFGFGASKSQADTTKPAESVTGKMFGFGSSIFSSASTLITSAVQDESKTTPPVSPKMPAAKDSKSPTAKKPEQEKKPGEPQPKGQASVRPKSDKPQSESPKKAPASPVISQKGKSACPLCKLQLNVGSKDPPNYSTCTDCKTVVCNQCGFNPMPNVKEVKEWLCLNCQMQRALGASEPPGMPIMKQQASPNKVQTPASAVKKEPSPQVQSQKKDISQPTESPGKKADPSGSPQRKPQTTGQQQGKSDTSKGPEKQGSPIPQKEIRKPSDPKHNATTSATQGESDRLLGSGGPRPQPDATKPAESVSGKMFGFSSSIFSSASALISSAVQDESKTTPPVSPKMQTAKTTKSPQIQRKDEDKKPGQVNQPNATPLPQAKVEKAHSQLQKEQTAPAASKAGTANCPLCKIQLNVGSKDPPNYNTCTQCKETVCNQCGFNPVPNMTEVKEWLCLNCQMQRALSASNDKAPTITSPNKANKISAQQKSTDVKQSEALKKEEKGSAVADPKGSTTVPIKKTLSPAGPLPKPETKGTDKTQQSPSTDQRTPEVTPKTVDSNKLPDQVSRPEPTQGKASSDTKRDAPPKTVSEPSKTTESVTGKMFGFGSSIFSSASTLISSAVQDESRITPPASRKMSAPAQASPKLSPVPKDSPKITPTVSPSISPTREPKTAQKTEEQKKPVQSQEKRNDKAPPQGPKSAQIADDCPLCKTKLNIGSKDPPNHNTCTECKTTVCNQCGFCPMPIGEVREWLCLNCQMKRAVTASEPPGPQAIKSQTSPSKVPTAGQKSDSVKSSVPEKKDIPEPALQKKTPEPHLPENVSKPDSQKQGALDQKASQQKPQKTPVQGTQVPRRQSKEQESGGFFGFGGPKSQPEPGKPAEPVGGKMFGFGSSIFNSASTLITSAVQDQTKTTPPVSPKITPAKMSPAKETKSLPSQKQEEQKKELAQETKASTLGQTKMDEAPSQPAKTAAVPLVKPGQSTCPLCKAQLNINTKDPPNYSTCTECKNTVCNQCGFNPTPNDLTVKKWLCLNCQMQRALAVTETPTQKAPQKEPTAPDINQKKLGEAATEADVTRRQQTSQVPSQKKPQEPVKTPDVKRKQSNATAKTEQDSGGIFGFGVKTQPDTAKPAESVTGKMFGFGSSIFSSASTLMSSVQDQPKTTPPVSPKMSPAKDIKSPAAQKNEQEKQPKPSQQTKTPPMPQAKVENAPPAPPKKTVSQDAAKVEGSTCPLCKAQLNIGSKDPPNYNSCTDCKSTVCNQCGFSPMPSVSGTKEWLCLTCQMQRALKQSEEVQPLVKKPLASPNKVSTPAAAPEVSVTQRKDITPAQKGEMPEKIEKHTLLQKKEETLASSKISTPDTSGSKEVPTSAAQETKKATGMENKAPSNTTAAGKIPESKDVHDNVEAQKVSDQKAKPADKIQGQQDKRKDSKTGLSSTNQESGGFFGFGSPKSQRSASIVPEPVTGKVLGFGSSLFSSASTFITSAVKEESRSTPPSSRKMSAPPQISDKTSPSKVSPKPSPPVSPKVTPAKDTKAAAAQKPDVEKTEDKPQKVNEKEAIGSVEAAKTESQKPDTKVGLSSCPLCKVELNMSKDSRNYNTCSQCKAVVCNKCGFSPMPTVSEVKEWLCLNCQMQRALGASEPPGLPMIKPLPSPIKETPPTSVSKDNVTKPVAAKNEPVDRSTVTTAGPEKLPEDAPKTQPATPPQQPLKAPTSVTKSISGTEELPSQKPATLAPSATMPAPPPGKVEEKQPLEQPATSVPSVPGSSPSAGPVGEKVQPQQPITSAPSAVVPAASKGPVEEKQPSEQPARLTSTAVTATTPAAPVEAKTSTKQQPIPTPATKSPVEIPSSQQSPKHAIKSAAPSGPAKAPIEQPPKPTPSVDTPAPPKAPSDQSPKPTVKSATPSGPAEAKAPAEQPPEPTPSAATPAPPKALSEQSPKPTVKSAAPPGPAEVKTPSQQPVKPTPSPATPPQKAPSGAKGASEHAVKPGAPAAKSLPSKEEKTPQPTPAAKASGKPAQPSVQPVKQESGGFFGFGGPKPQPTAAKPAESVTGKMFGFGSSFLSSASNLITSAVQDEPKTTPPTPRKMSAAQVSPKITPPASPKSVPPVVRKAEEKKPQPLQQEKAPVIPGKVDKVTPEPSKAPVDTKAAKAEKSTCPLCKVELNVGSTDTPNYNICTECKTTVCNQCGFNPMPNVTEVKEWLCLDCQMKRALGPSASTGIPVTKSQATSKEQKDKPLVQKEKPLNAQVKETVSPTPPRKEVPKDEPSVPTPVQETVTPRKGSIPKSQAITETQQTPATNEVKKQQPVGKPQPGQPTPSAKPEVKETLPKQEVGKPTQQPSKPATSPAKAPSPAQPPKQESGGFFGLGGPKTQPTTAKTESVTGKMFGFGSSFLSSASTLITSAVQDESKTTPPVSPKMSPAKAKTAEKSEQPPPAKATPPVQKKMEKVPQEPPKGTAVTPKAGPTNCPLCKVALNVGSKDSPNYNTCTECKNIVCNLCGFNPMPHTAVKEWLCLNCQTQRALSGQLGDSGKMSQPLPASVKSETQPTPPLKKAEPQTSPAETKPAPTAAKPKPESTLTTAAPPPPPPPISTQKGKTEPVSSKMETAKTEAKPVPTPERLPTASESKPLPPAKKEPIIPSATPEKSKPEVTKEVTVETKKEAENTRVSVKDITKKEEAQLDQPKAEAVVAASPVPPTKATVAPICTVPSEVAEVLPVAQKKPSEVIKLTEDTKALQSVGAEPKSQEPQPERNIELVSAADKAMADKVTKEITTTTVTKADNEDRKETVKEERKASIIFEEAKLEISPVTATVPHEDHDASQPQVLPITEELKDTQVVSDTNENNIKQDQPLVLKEDVKTERRRLSFQAMEESSESELTPSPKVQRRRLRVTRVSSSSEDLKTESADSSVEDEEFIRKQIMGMRDEEEMSLSEDDKENKLESEDTLKKTELDNASAITKPFARTASDNEGDATLSKAPLQAISTQEVKETTFKKATPAMRQRQSTDEEVESITESLSKGSSSVQVSSFTPGSSPTSASSLDEDSDSSPSHRKVTGEKPHRKGKHRQPTQPLPTIEDSSEEERMREEEKSWREKDEEASSSEELRQVTVVSDKTSGSDYSVSLESDPVDRQAVQRGRKPSPTVIPFTPEPVQQAATKTLKSADEAYEEILQKTKAIPGESPPDIEPLYGGMPIEDYLYESLVEEPEIKVCEGDDLKVDSISEPAKKLRSPEEVYEEMMQKKRELMMIEQEFQQAQTSMESSTAGYTKLETCVVAMPYEEPSPATLADTAPTGGEIPSDMQVKKKKRPAPPRPTEPPKRPEVTFVPSPPTGISFVRPMVPQDPALVKALFPIPDLKITQCSSGEEEEDSLADEYGVGMSSDITPSDDSDTKEQSFSPTLSETAEMEPISVVCEIPEPKPIPTPISAPELTSTPSPVSTVSPPTSPATPESSLASNATSSSSYHAQTPLSSDSTPLSTPTPPTSVVTQSPQDATVSVVPQDIAPDHALATVVVTIPDVVSEPPKPPLTDVVRDQAKDKTSSVVETSAYEPVVPQMPDLVSSPSQMPAETLAITQATAARVEPTVVSVQSTTHTVTAAVRPVGMTQADSLSTTLASSAGPVIVQMPDLVSTTSPISAVSTIVTTPSQPQSTMVHSVLVQPAVPSMTPVIVSASAQPAQVPAPTMTSTTIVKRKVPPPPPPRSTSVSLPDADGLARTVSPTVITTTAITSKPSQPMQSVVVDIQPRMEDSASAPHLVTPTRQGHVVIIVPSKEKVSQDISSTISITSTSFTSQTTTHTEVVTATTLPTAVSDKPDIGASSVSTKVAAMPVASAPPVPPKPLLAATAAVETVEITVSDTPPPAPTTLPKPHIHPKTQIPTVTTTTSTTTVSQASVTTTVTSQTAKPPPPIPPKPISIPAGLVFSHKPGETIKPPYAIPKAATLPRTKEPPNALSLSITRPVESKMGATSPKSPVSPRHAKCLQTYVVITLPSEPGSPTESITVLAPVRRGSIPATKVSEVRTTPAEQKTTTEPFSAQATARRASVPTVRYPPPMPVAPTVVVAQKPSMVVTETQPRQVSVSSVQMVPSKPVIAGPSSKDAPIQVQSVVIPVKKPYVQLIEQPVEQKPIMQSIPPTEIISEIIMLPSEPVIPIQPQTIQVTARAQPILTGISSEVSLDRQATDSTANAVPQADTHVEIQQIALVGTSAIVNEPETIATEQELHADLHSVHIIADLPQVIQQPPMQQPTSVADVMMSPKKIELPKELITEQAVIQMPPPTEAEVRNVISTTTADIMPSSMLMGVQQMAVQPVVAPISFIQDSYAPTDPTVMQPPTPPLEIIALPYERLTEMKTEDVVVRSTTLPGSTVQPQTVIPVEVITKDETRTRRTSISSIVQPTYLTSQTVPYPTEYEIPTQIVTTEAYASTRRESITLQQPIQTAEVVHMPTEKDISIDMPDSNRSEQKPVYISEYDHSQIRAEDMYTRRSSIPLQDIPQAVSGAPVTITKIQQESVESQEIRGQEKVVSSLSHVYSSSISTSGQPPESLPSLVTQVVTTEVQRTTVSVVHERLPQAPPPNVSITIQPDIAKVSPLPKQNGRIVYPGDVVDLRTMRDGVKMTEQGMDLTPPESCRQSFSSDLSGRQITAVQPEIVNLSAEVTPSTTLSVVTDSITIVTCTATIASYTPAEKPLDLQGSVTSVPLPLTTYKPFEPLAQIVYRPVNSIPLTSTVASTVQDLPINLSYGALVSSAVKQPPTSPSGAVSNGGPVISLEATGAIDLSNYKPVRAMVALSGTSPGVVTTVIEDDDTPIDLTAGSRNVCCDVIYKLPFTGSCRTQPPVTMQPDSQQDTTGLYSIKGMNGMRVSLSETNIPEVALVAYDPNKDYDYLNGSSDGAIDLTAAKLSAGKPLDYTSKATGAYPEMPTSPYGQIPATGFGVNSVIRTSDGMVYTSVAAPVPSTYAITTQPGSIFSTTLSPVSTAQNQSLLQPYGFIPTTDPGQIIPYETGMPKELVPTALADIITGYHDMYSDMTLEAIAASLDALASSPIFPGLDSTKMAQYQMEREFLELEKLKQICLAEELEWERQEIQRYREQEQMMVQRELEELQALKQQLLLQQEEEHHAHMVAQQETYAQQKEQLQQIQQLQIQLQRQLDEHYGTNTAHLLEAKYAGVGDSGQYWPVKDESSTIAIGVQLEESQDQLNIKKLQADQDTGKKIIDSGVHTDDEDSTEKQTTSSLGRRKKSKRTSDSSPQTDDEDEWDAPTKARRRSRKHSSEGKHGSKVSSIAIQTVAEISVQTDHSGSIKRPNVQMDTKVEIIKHISAPENSQRGGSLSCQTDSDRRHAPIEVGYSTHLTTDVPSKCKVFYSAVSPVSPEKSLGGQRMLMADPNRFSSGPRSLKPGHKSLSDPKSLSPTTDDRMGGYYADSYSGRPSPSSTGKKVKRTLPDPPPEDESLSGRSGYSTNSARRRLARSTTMARAKILQDIDKELDLVERESSKLRKKQAELDEEEKEIDAKLRYLEMGINRRKEALLKEREKRERAYLQGVAEERDYMSDSEVSNIREARGEGLERPRTAPQSEFDQFIPPQTEADSQYNTLTSPYSHYAQYVPQTQTTSHYTQQNLYQQQSLYHQQVSPYQNVPTLSLSQAQTSSYQHALLLQQGKQRQTTLSDLDPKIATNYEVIRNQPLLIVPTSSESGYGVASLGSKFTNLDLRLGLEERSMASSPMSSISADSFYADIDHHNARNYVLIEDIGELTKASSGMGSTGFSLPDKELSKADRLLRAAEVRRTAEMADFLGSSRLQGYSKGEDDTMEEPYELKLLKQQIKQEFRRGTEGLEHLTGLGLPQYLHTDPSFRHFPKGEKYSIGRLTLEKQAAKQLPAAVLYQKQMKNKKALIDPKAINKCSPIQESRDLEPDFASYMGSGASSVTNLAARARLLQDEITFGLRKNLAEQQKYLGSSLGANLASSLNLGQTLGLGSAIRGAHDDGTYPSGSRSRPSSRPSSVYGLDLSIKRDISSSSLRLKPEGDVLDAAFAPGVARTKPTSLPISQSRGRIPIVAQNSEEESPLSPVGQPMGMARASAGPLPPISADTRDQFGSSHSLPEVQQHMREESRTRGYDRDIAFIMDDLQGAMSDSEAGGPNWNIEAYHLRREDTDWFDKPREGHPQSGHMDRRQIKLVPYAFPHARIKLKRDQKDTSVSGNGLGIRVVGGKEIPGSRGEIGAYIAAVIPGGVAEQTGKVTEGMQVLEWNGVPLTGKTYEEVQCIMAQPCAEAELCVRLDLNMLSDPEHPQALEHHPLKSSGQRSPGVDPKQLAAELQKVSQQQTPGIVGAGMGPGGMGVLSALERSALLQSSPGSAASSGVPSPGQPASPAINKKQRHKPADVMRTPHPITGEIQLQINYDRNLGNLIVHVLQARNLAPRDNDGYSDPFVKVYLLPGRGADNKRRTKYAQKTSNPEWNQTVIYKNIHLEQLKKKTLEVTVWDYDRSSSNDFLGEVLIDLSNTAQLDNIPRWLPLKEQSESIEHSRAHHATQGPPGSGSGQSQGHSQGQGHMSGSGMGHGNTMGQGHTLGLGEGHDSPKNSVIKSRSHGIFPDPAKDMQMLPLEKSHSSPGSSKSSSDGQLRSHGPSRSQSKSSVTQAHLEDAGIAIAAAEAAVQQSRLQPRPGHRLGDVSGSVVLSAPSLVGDAYGDGEEGADTGVDSAIFQVPRIKAIPNGTDKHHIGTPESEGGKVQVMGEIKVALKKEVKTEGDQLVLEILQCRNITYKFKSPDHLPDLYVKLYVVNVATQKRIIKKKTRVCRHDREPSFNETFRFPLNPTGHSIQLFLVSNGGKFMKKTLIGEAYIWLDKVDMRKRVVSWHKLLASTAQTNP